jgi:hypothetical protein
MLTQRGLLVFACYSLALVAALVALRIIPPDVFTITLASLIGYLVRDSASALRNVRRRVDKQDTDK